MIENEKQSRQAAVLAVARDMMTAARTAPKGKGVDNLEIITLSGDDLPRLAAEMRRYSERSGMKFFLRDANNVEAANAVVVIGTRLGVFRLNCGYCGFPTCEAKTAAAPDAPCAFNTNDLGIAVGSAAAVAADRRIDNRIMYSAARAALDLGLLGDCRAAFAILLSCTGKNPFFDRKSEK